MAFVLDEFKHGVMFGCCSGIRSLLWWKDCTYICSYGNRRVGLLICLISVMVSLILPYSFLQLSICSAYVDRGSLLLMYRTCPWNIDLRLRLVCST